MFASELKAFYEYHEFDKTINQSAVNLFLKTGYIKSPLSIYEFTHKLAPGSFLEIDQDFNIRTWKYWDVREKYYNTNINNKDEKLLIPECEKVLEESFGLRMVSDVPVGLFLSGGVDSSIVTALLQKNSDKPLNTFTIGFHEKKYNEANYAKKVAEHIGTYHTELYCTENDFKDIIVDLPEFYDEPFGDSSAIPTYLVSKLARKSVTVCLSADGGDELFTGYNRYLFAENLASKLSLIPSSFRHVISNMLENIDVRSIEFIQNIFPQINESRIIKLSEALKSQSKIDFLYASTQYISKNKIKQLHLFDCNDEIFDKSILIKENSEYSAFGVVDIESYLEGDILTKVDRATMQVALEGREPFLDHKIIEYALGLPDSVKIKNGDTKWILKQILYQYVPQKLIERPKMGFGIPLENWLKCLLKDDLIQMINDKNFIMSFKLSEDFLKEIVYNYFNKNIGSSYFLWNLYALYSWYKRWLF
jgi:asparagine synthase (glutamine-hydrolysing)